MIEDIRVKEVFEAILVILFILVSVVGLGYAVGVLFESIFEDEDYMTGNFPKITFKLFIEMYAINPNNWEFKDTHVCYNRYGERHRMVFKTKRDFGKYKKFKEKEETRKREVERLKEEAKIAKCFQDDIDRYRAETMKEMKSHLPENMIPHETGALRRSNTYEQKE